MATSCIEQQALNQLSVHTSAVGFDIIRTQMLKRKGIIGCMRKNRIFRELEDMRSYDMSIVNSMQSISAVQTTTGNCIHCMQDARLGLFNPEEREDEQTYLVATENCEIHEFRGDNWVEAGCRRIRKRTCGCIGRVARDTERERLPFAFVTLNTKLLMIMAARRLWAPNTITGVYGWVPVHPLSADGVYRREEYDKRESLPRKNVPS